MATQTIERSVQRPAADLEALFRGRYLSVTSFKRDGTGVATPVWFVSDGRRLFALTDLHSGKVRRIRHNPRVLVAACRADGKLRGKPLPALAEVLTATPELERVQKLLMERYKITAEQAFTLLTHASQRSNTKLRDIAEELATTGVLRGS